MRFIIYGAGAVGGVVGGRLAQYGNDVVLIARGEHLAAIRANGLTIASPADTVTVQAPAVGHPSEIDWQPGDVAVLAMKTQDTGPALEALEAAAGCDIPVICVQNGVENERLALRRFARVYATSVMLPATHLEPGVVQADSAPVSGILDTGCYPHGTDDVCEAWCAALERSTFSAKPEPRPMWRKYTKLLMNLGNAFQAICGAGADGRELLARARQEGIACYRAAGIEFATEEEDRERRGTLIRVGPIAGKVRGGGSSWQSMVRGKTSIEADYLNGEICLLGRLHSIPTPVNALLRETANRMAREGQPPGTLTVEDLLARL
ncbi:MAG: ketopantoate reductase family protein [Chloroflexi bacterium]|nr:ketopantoate reductase family protein [Chloroflexota bacterium]